VLLLPQQTSSMADSNCRPG